MDPRELMTRLRRGDPVAFERVYTLCAPRLYRFLLRLTRDAELALELAQETWLRFAAHARKLPEELEPAAWLFRVARNLYVSERRHATFVRERMHACASWLTSTGTTPHEELTASEQKERLERAIAALPLPQREVFLLVAVERLDPIEAASLLRIAPEAARQRLARARASLQRVLDEADPRLQTAGERP
jgi:RNA polymerase sigma-70 factor (ECF subfamily)